MALPIRLARQAPWLLAGALLTAGAGCAQRTLEPRLTEDERELNVASFDQVWTTVKERHWDPELDGLNWDALRDELRPAVAEARTMSAARATMADLIARLEQSHFAIVPRSVYEALEREETPDVDATADGVLGVDVRVLAGAATVTRIHADSAAARAGVQPGWIIVSIDGQPLAPALERVAESYADSSQRDFMLARAVANRLRGPAGEPVAIEFHGDGDAVTILEIARGVPSGTRAQFGNLPPFYVRFDEYDLEGGIGYIAFNAFFDPPTVMARFGAAVRARMDAPGIIIDLRGNPGGIAPMAMGMAGWFVDEPNQQLGRMKLRDSTINFAVFPRATTYRGPLAILIDGCTASTAEILAAGMRDIGRARLFGTPTIGAALPSVVERLPNGDGFQYAIANYVSASGRRLEGNGVDPDETVKLDRQSLLAGDDPVIRRAVEWIQQRTVRHSEPASPNRGFADAAARHQEAQP